MDELKEDASKTMEEGFAYDNSAISADTNNNAETSPSSSCGIISTEDEDKEFQTVLETEEVEEDVDEEINVKEASFGWMSYRPKCMQAINNPVGYCTLFCLLTVIQSMTSFGLVYVNLTTLERRFGFSSVQSGWISSSYDLCNLFVAVFVSYFGEKGHRPLWVGVSSVLFAMGYIIFTIPHFASPNYIYQETISHYCDPPNETSMCGDAIETQYSSNYFWVFILAQVLHGIGSASLYTLGVAYIDENVPTRHFGVYMAIYQAVCIIGPSLGYALGGIFLSIYTDVQVDKESITIDENSPLWVGAWWIGILMNGVILFIFSLIYMGFPKDLPGGSKILKDRQFETQKGSEFSSKDGALNEVIDLPRAVWTLITNAPFMFMNMTVVVQFFLLAGLSVFGPKYIESQLSMTPSEAAYFMGLVSVSGGILGAIIGGILVNRLDLKFPGLMKLCATCAFLSMSLCFVFTAVCPTVDFAGVTVAYENTSMIHKGTAVLNATCNSHCVCPSSYDPICGSDGVIYYSACHAGCDINTLQTQDVIFTECRCVLDPTSASGLGTADSGTCDTSCPYTGLYFAALFLVILLGAMTGVSTWTATIRIVSYSQRAFALGFQTLIYALLGSVPGPIVFGAVLDRSCLLWETDCEGTGNCWLYANQESALWFLIFSVGCQFLAVLFFLLALISYRPSDNFVSEKRENERKQDRLKNKVITAS